MFAYISKAESFLVNKTFVCMPKTNDLRFYIMEFELIGAHDQ